MARCKISRKYSALSFFILIFLVVPDTSYAIDRKPAEPDSVRYIEIIEPDDFKPTMQIAVGVSTRIDEREKIINTEIIHTKIYYTTSKYLSVIYGLGHTINSQFKSKYSLKGAGFNLINSEIGFRWSTLGKNVKLFLESSLQYNYYYADESSVDAQRIGMKFSTGVHFLLIGNIAADISIGHTVNNINSNIQYINPEDDPSAYSYELDEDYRIGIRNGTFYQEIYNPTSLTFLLFYQL